MRAFCVYFKELEVKRMKKLLFFAVVFITLFAISAKPALAATPNWDVKGTWSLDFSLGESHYFHTMFVNSFNPITGVFSGTGIYTPDTSYTWTVTGTISGDDVTFDIHYTDTNAGYTSHVIGAITGATSMSGTWRDSGNASGTWIGTGTAKDITIPSVPTGIYFKDTVNNKSVACGGVTSARNFDVYWNANPESDIDHYEYDSYNAGGSIGLVDYPLTTPYFLASWWTVPTEGTYGVQVRAVDKAGNKSEWSGGALGYEFSCKYTADWTAPSTPVLQVPVNNSVVTVHNFIFDWSDVIDLTAVTYDWEGSLVNDFSIRGMWNHYGLPGSYVDSPGTPDNVYYWHVRACDAAGNCSPWTGVWKVTVNTTTSPIVVGPPTNMDQCKKSGWMTFNNPRFRNQGDCVSWLQSNINAIGNRKDN